MMLPSRPIDLKCLDFTRCWANLLVEITTAYLPCGRQWQFVVSIEFHLSSQLFADHYTGSASPRLALERCRPCAGLFAHSFIYAIQISTFVHLGCEQTGSRLFQWDKKREGKRERELTVHWVPACFVAVLASIITDPHYVATLQNVNLRCGTKAELLPNMQG